MAGKGADKSKSASCESGEKESSGVLAVVVGMIFVLVSLIGTSTYGGPYYLFGIAIFGIGVILTGLAVYLRDILRTLREIRDK